MDDKFQKRWKQVIDGGFIDFVQVGGYEYLPFSFARGDEARAARVVHHPTGKAVDSWHAKTLDANKDIAMTLCRLWVEYDLRFENDVAYGLVAYIKREADG